MLLVHTLWFTLVFGGLFMGVGAVHAQVRDGFDLVLTLSALLYLGCAFYSLPRLWALFTNKHVVTNKHVEDTPSQGNGS